MSLNHGHDYTIWLPDVSVEELRERVAAIAGAESLQVDRPERPQTKGKPKGGFKPRMRRDRKPKTYDLQPSIRSIAVREDSPVPAVDLRLVTVDGRAGKAREVLELLTDHPDRAVVVRRDTLTERDGQHESLSAGWVVGAGPDVLVTVPALR